MTLLMISIDFPMLFFLPSGLSPPGSRSPIHFREGRRASADTATVAFPQRFAATYGHVAPIAER